jgi:hypothetical protein
MPETPRPTPIDSNTDRERDRSTLDDLSIRVALRSRLLEAHSFQTDTIVLEELGLCRGRVRIDVAVVNGSLCGYEIKSDRDNLRRLTTQIDVYGKVLDEATLVVGNRLLAEAIETVPRWWGVLRVTQTNGGVEFTEVRCPRRNPQRNARALVELLWCDDALALLERRNAARGVRGKPRRIVWDRVCNRFDVEEIGEAVRAQLKSRATLQAPE